MTPVRKFTLRTRLAGLMAAILVAIVPISALAGNPTAAPPPSDRDLADPLPAIHRPNTNPVVDEMRDDNLPRPANGERSFGHRRHIVDSFTPDGNWKDLGTAVAADQVAGMTPLQVAEFMRTTGAKPEEIRPGDAALMQLPPTRNWDLMKAPRPDIRYREIDRTRLGTILIDPQWLVIHYTAGVNDTTDGIWKLFNANHGAPSTQFVIGKKGDILQMLPETEMCDGTLDFNDHTIQIEVCGDFRLERETDEEVAATAALVRYLQKKHHIPDTQIISHRQVDNNFGHVGRKPDPTFRFMNRLYSALQNAAPDRPAHVPTLQGIDMFGSHQVRLEEVKTRFGAQIEAMAQATAQQDGTRGSELQRQIEEGLHTMAAFAYAKVSLITYYPPKNAQYVTVDLVDEKDRQARMSFAPAPQGTFGDPDGLLAAWDDYQKKGYDLARQDQIVWKAAAPNGPFHIVFGFEHPELAPYLQRFNTGAQAHQQELVRILRQDGNASHRANAAFLLAHTRNGQELVRILVPAIRDPEELVRNNVMRVLALMADTHPEIDIPVAPVASALHYPSTTDRNKAAAILYGLSKRPSCRTAIVREGPTLLEMLRLMQPNNHDYAYQILCQVSGERFGERDYDAWEKWVGAHRS